MTINLHDILVYNRIALDTNIFIYALNNNPKFPIAVELIKHLPYSNHRIYTSTITLTEIVVPLYIKDKPERISKYIDFVSGYGRTMILDVDQSIAIKAAEMRAVYRLKTPDAIQLATALVCKADVFITADQGYKIEKIDNLKIIKLSPNH